MLKGLLDRSIALELLTKRIENMTEAIHEVTLYETYKRGMRDRHGGQIRQLNVEEYQNVDLDKGYEIEIRKVDVKRFVTEEK